MSDPIKLSSTATREFWEITVLFEDEHLLALDKPERLLTSPDRLEPARPSPMQLLHAGLADGKPWAKQRGLSYLANAHRLDAETSGVLLFAKNKAALVALANLFGAEKPLSTCLALVQGAPEKNSFDIEVAVAPHPLQPGLMRADSRHGKRAKTHFELLEKFRGRSLLQCQSLTNRAQQVRAHLQYCGCPILGDRAYGGHELLLSSLKPAYRLKGDRTERPLLSRAALHAEKLELPHPITGQPLAITAEWPKDLKVAVKYLRLYAAGSRPSPDAAA